MTRRLLWVGRLDEHDRPPMAVYLGYPAVLHRVVVTGANTEADQVDPFQTAVRGLIAAGVGTVTEISSHLGIADPRFIDHVLDELELDKHVSRGARRLQLTDSGRRAVEHHGDPLDQKSWYVVQDALTGQFWSRVVERFRPVRATAEGSRRFAELGTHGDPHRVPYWEMRWPLEAPPIPSVDEARAAVQNHLQLVQAARRALEGDEFNHLPRPARHSRFAGRDVKLMRGLEEQVWVIIRLSHRTSATDSSMMVHDPFGLGSLPALEHSVDQELEQFDRLASFVDLGLRRLRQRNDSIPDPPWEPAAREHLSAALRAAIDNSPTRTLSFAGTNSVDERLFRIRLEYLGFEVPSYLPPMLPGVLVSVSEGAPGSLHEMLRVWVERCTDDIGHAVAQMAPNLPQVVIALGNETGPPSDRNDALQAIHGLVEVTQVQQQTERIG